MSETVEITEDAWLLPRLWAVFVLLLVAATYPLWFSAHTVIDMPSIPLLDLGIRLPAVTSVVASVLLVIGLLLVILAPLRFRNAWWLVAGSLLVSFLLDQHRLQPWAYQTSIYALVFATMGQTSARRWLIPLAASVYLYSAAGKFDFQFAHTVGQDFLQTLTRPLGGLPDHMDHALRAKLAMCFPALEFLAGTGLLFRATRNLAAVAVILMHATLIGILGPWGLHHSTGVLTWNLLLMVQAYLLMFQPQSRNQMCRQQDQPPINGQLRQNQRFSFGSLLARGVVLLALAAPLRERSGYWDHWTSWSLYSPHTSRVEIELHRSAVDSFDPHLRSFISKDANGDGWQELAIGEWSLECRGVPIYPQGRYQLALAAAIASQYQLNDEIRARLRSVSDRWTGRRSENLMLGRQEIQSGLKSFWLTR